LALGCIGCLPGATERAVGQDVLKPTTARRVAFLGGYLEETSGVALSRTYPGILWSHNDSGNQAGLFATDTLGADRGRFVILGARNRDWEDMGLGPCPAGTCLYIAETGDNGERRQLVAVYRIPEPDPSQAGLLRQVQRLVFRYPDQPRDVEAIFVAPDTSIHLISKGIRSGVTHYRLPARAWQRPDTATAEALGAVPIQSAVSTRRLVTGAAISPDGQTVVVLTYRDIHRFLLRPDGTLVPAQSLSVCDISGLVPQAEAVAWLDLAGTLVLTSETGRGLPAQVVIVRCPWPE
jgi:hypothetical protein